MPFTVPLQDLARTMELDKWMRKHDWPRERYFAAIDKMRSGLRDLLAKEPTDDQVVALLAAAVEEEDGLTTHCLDGGYEIGGDEGWKQRCNAAAWMILRRYNRAVKDGRWEPQ